MNVLTESQQEKLNALPVHHGKAPYKVIVDLRRNGDRSAKDSHVTYVMATSEHRAQLTGFWSVKNLYGGLYRKKGLIVSRANAFIVKP